MFQFVNYYLFLIISMMKDVNCNIYISVAMTEGQRTATLNSVVFHTNAQ